MYVHVVYCKIIMDTTWLLEWRVNDLVLFWTSPPHLGHSNVWTFYFELVIFPIHDDSRYLLVHEDKNTEQ